MLEWINQVMGSPMLTLAVLPAAFFLGVLGAVSSCCNVAVLGAIAGYSLGENRSQRTILLSGLFFLLGTIIALAVAGAITGFVSQLAGSVLGGYWKLFAGFIMILFGLVSLKLLPFNLPDFFTQKAMPSGNSVIGAIVFGFAIGGSTTACSASCNPVILIALGAAALHGHTLWGAAILALFALGYALPFSGAIIGLGLGFEKLTVFSQKVTPIIVNVAGIMMIGSGFYMLLTL
jgi:cytochrome c biogenesis protein CcdA